MINASQKKCENGRKMGLKWDNNEKIYHEAGA